MDLSIITWYKKDMFPMQDIPNPFPIHEHMIMKETQETLEQFIFRICFLLHYVKPKTENISTLLQISLMLRNKIFMCCGYNEEIEVVLTAYLEGQEPPKKVKKVTKKKDISA